ncbi:MAG TPA: alpha/beta fold hydrolase [Nocardioidaceae bacterium]|nr:alpha/beta fold hydrolase [Nocardioidaceae bacterium]
MSVTLTSTNRSGPLPVPALTWSAPDQDGLEHAVIEVPQDYADPTGTRIEIAVARLPATDPTRRLGVLLAVNGGPGGDSGHGARLPLHFGERVREVYDLIGFDPRGTGGSTRLHTEVTIPVAPFDSRPPDSLFEQLAEDMRARELACKRAGGTFRQHVTTRNTARDMDLLRTALGEKKISFVGYAYGSYVGAVYGSMFPQNLDRIVLDSCVNPDWSWREQFVTQAEAVFQNVSAWADWAAQRHGTFGLGDEPDLVIAAVEDVADTISRRAEDGVRLRTLFDGAVGTRATDRAQWASLAELVAELRGQARQDPDRTRLLIVGEGTWRPQDQEGDLRVGVLEAITLETEWPTDLGVYQRDVRYHRAHHPYGFGVLRAQPWVGAFRTFASLEPPTVIERDGYAPGLVVQTDGDPFDRYEGGLAMAERLGFDLVVVVDSGEHEVYALAGNPQVDAIVDAYLIDGVRPGERTEVASTVRRPDVPADVR